MIKKSDIILTICLVIVGVALSIFISFGQQAGDTVEITCRGDLYGTYNLNEDNEITIKEGNSINKITIKDGKVSMAFSNCHSQDCVETGAVSKSGESIVCLPHKVVINITGGDAEYDSVSR